MKLKVKKRLQKKYKIKGYIEKKHKCPVYLCKFSDDQEDKLIEHYNTTHKDLLKLGLKLIKSKETRDREKKKKNMDKANRIVLNTEQDD